MSNGYQVPPMWAIRAALDLYHRGEAIDKAAMHDAMHDAPAEQSEDAYRDTWCALVADAIAAAYRGIEPILETKR